MKKTLFILSTIIIFAAMSCSEDYSDPKVLSGTIWRCSSFPAVSMFENSEYVELQFISTSQVASWQKYKDESVYKSDIIASYTISNKTITITDTGSENYTGEIENTKMTLLIEGNTLVFRKQ